MSVQQSGFAERVFEFAFNAEYADSNWAVLACAPYIPSQNEEKHLGYDVEFVVEDAGGVTRFIALQHKVARYVDKKANKNAEFWAAGAGPYFAFRLDVEQFNKILAVSGLQSAGLEIYYCAPLFVTHGRLNAHYMAKNVEQHSAWINVENVGALAGGTHSMIYSLGGGATVFSEPQRAVLIKSEERATRSRERRENMRVNLFDLDGAIRDALGNFGVTPRRKTDKPPTVKSISRLLTRHLGVSVLLDLPKKPDLAAAKK